MLAQPPKMRTWYLGTGEGFDNTMSGVDSEGIKVVDKTFLQISIFGIKHTGQNCLKA